MAGKTTLGDLQLAIMRVLWKEGEATVTHVYELLYPERGLAPSTIATMLRKMEAKGVITHRQKGRQFIYRPTVAESDVHRGMVNQLVDRLFGGDPIVLVDHLIREGDVDWKQLDAQRRRVGLIDTSSEEDRDER